MLLLDLAHPHILLDLGQAVIANRTPGDHRGSGRLRTICSKNGDWKRQAFHTSSCTLAKPIKFSATLSFSVAGPVYTLKS